MQKLLRIFCAGAFMLFIVYNYFQTHPYYINFAQIQQASSWSQAFSCPGLGAVLCSQGVNWLILLLIGVIIIGVSLYFWMHKGTPVVAVKLSPLQLFGYFNLFLLILVSVYFFLSPVVAHAGFEWGSSMVSFISYWLATCFYLLIFLFSFSAIGYTILRLLKLTFADRPVRVTIGVALGMSLFIWVFAILGQLHLFTFGWVLAFLLLSLVALFWMRREIIGDFVTMPIQFSFSYRTLSWFLIGVLFLVIGMNIIDLMRPVPVGWDDLGVYMNFPRQMALTGGVLAGYPGQGYMLISALGFVLANSTTVALCMSWFGGILAVYALYTFGKQFISSEAGLLMASIMYLLPMTMHQSFADMKTDMPLFFFIVSAFLVIFLALREKTSTRTFTLLNVIAGVLFGTALSIKITTAIALFPLFIILAWRLSGPLTGIALFGVLNGLYFYKFVFEDFIPFSIRKWIAITSFVLGVLVFIASFIRKERIFHYLRSMIVLGLAVFVVLLPWFFKHWSETKSFSVEALLYGGSSPGPVIAWEKVGVDFQLCKFTGAEEELGRYIGRTDGPEKYLRLPWDITMNTNQAGFYVDISFLFLALIPLIIFTVPSWLGLLAVIISSILLASIGFMSGFTQTNLLIGYVVKCLPFMLLLATLPYGMGVVPGLSKENQSFWQNILLLFLLCWYFWMFVASGVPWYGVAGFLFALALVAFVWQNVARIHHYGKVVITILIIISLGSTLLLRETKFGNTQMLGYAFGQKSADEVLASTNRLYPAVIKELNSDHGYYIYRVGTFINYFIDNNRERVFDDAQLDVFTCLDSDGTNNARTLERLKQLNFRYLIYDTYTASIEKNKDGTLHKKVKRFTDFASVSLKRIVPGPTDTANTGIILFEIP